MRFPRCLQRREPGNGWYVRRLLPSRWWHHPGGESTDILDGLQRCRAGNGVYRVPGGGFQIRRGLLNESFARILRVLYCGPLCQRTEARRDSLTMRFPRCLPSRRFPGNGWCVRRLLPSRWWHHPGGASTGLLDGLQRCPAGNGVYRVPGGDWQFQGELRRPVVSAYFACSIADHCVNGDRSSP